MPSGTQQERDGHQVPDEVFEKFGSGPPTAEEQQRAENEKKKLLGLVNFTPYESNPDVDEGQGQREDPNIVDTAEAIAAARAILSRVPPAERVIVVNALEEDLEDLAAGGVSAGRDDLATPEPRPDQAAAKVIEAGETRLKWDTNRLPDENPAEFAWRAYAVEAAAGTLHLGVIRQEDEPLAVKLVSWLRSPANRKQVPEGFDIPTKPEWNTRQLAKVADPVPSGRRSVRTPEARLYDAARYRAAKPA